MAGTPRIEPIHTAETILVVDDDPKVLMLCSPLLKYAGYHVLEAGDSAQTLKHCAEYPRRIDLLLTDLLLLPPTLQLASEANQYPNIHGHELAARVTASRPVTRILLMSGNPDEELTRHRIARGSYPFVQKPFDITLSLI
ncbi:MAG: hypothetical protein KF814_04380 [Nitrospiraceae bacterium]|nr:hypothetical protein [Nitrospiraceae bacterium]